MQELWVALAGAQGRQANPVAVHMGCLDCEGNERYANQA